MFSFIRKLFYRKNKDNTSQIIIYLNDQTKVIKANIDLQQLNLWFSDQISSITFRNITFMSEVILNIDTVIEGSTLLNTRKED